MGGLFKGLYLATGLTTSMTGACWLLTALQAGPAVAEQTRSSASADLGRRADEPPPLQTVVPSPGGLPREVVQTGSLEASESADLYAKVSGYLSEVTVDIGAAVRQGQTLARIDVPELVKQADRARAVLEEARSQVAQAEARLLTAEADHQAARAVLDQSQTEIARTVAEAALSDKEYQRIRRLSDQGAIQDTLADEKLYRLQAARAGEHSAHAGVLVAGAKLTAAAARVEQARADLRAAEAAVRVAAVAVEQADIMLAYTGIVAPFDGVVTQRNFDPGAFIRSAESGAQPPLFNVARTDRVRVVVYLADVHVPYIGPGHPAEVRVATLGGEVFAGEISRLGHSQNPRTRTMRAEIDLPNRHGRLRSGMYAAVTIRVPASSGHLTVPAECLVDLPGKGERGVYVIRDGLPVLAPVRVGRCAGERAELLSGLEQTDQVVVNWQEIEDRSPAMVIAGPPATAGSSAAVLLP